MGLKSPSRKVDCRARESVRGCLSYSGKVIEKKGGPGVGVPAGMVGQTPLGLGVDASDTVADRLPACLRSSLEVHEGQAS